MRVIKFRAWQDNMMIYPDGAGIYNTKYFLEKLYEDCNLMQFTGLIDKNGKEIYEGDLIKITMDEWENGMPSGVDYEGEETYDSFPERTIIGEVKIRSQRGAGFVYKKDIPDTESIWGNDEPDINLKNHWFKIHSKTDEVIGNIYENPELLAGVE